MEMAQNRGRFDWLVELGGAAALTAALGFAGFKLAPSLGFSPALAMTESGAVAFALGFLAMQMVDPESREHRLAEFSVDPVSVIEDPLLLDVRYEEPLLLKDFAEEEALLLDDPLVGAAEDSRVVQLFANPPPPTPGQLSERIDRHLATGAMPAVWEHERPAPDASDALYAALADLRRSLR